MEPIAVTKSSFVYFNGGEVTTVETMEPLPQVVEDQVDVYYIAGPSGSGKTTFICKYLQKYRYMFPENRIAIFSRKTEDKNLDGCVKGGIERIKLDEDLLNLDTIDLINEFADSVVIFDDIATIPDDEIRSKVYKIQNDLITVGRDKNIYVMATNHQIRDGYKTRELLNEATHIVLFPGSNQGKINTFLKKAMDFDKHTIETIKKLDTRWIDIHTRYPCYIISEHKIFAY